MAGQISRTLVVFLVLLGLEVEGCSQVPDALESAVVEAVEGQGDGRRISPADPPYGPSVTYPSGLRLDDLVQVSELSAAYPNPNGGRLPFPGLESHYAAVEYFIDIKALPESIRQAQVSQHFTLNDFVWLPDRNQDQHAYIDAEIVWRVEELRRAWGGRIVAVSTYRSPAYNAAVGGAFFSRHMYGDAVDINVPDRTAARDFYNMARALDIDFIDAYGNTIDSQGRGWVHIDTRGF
jgi:hypothetical protein